MGWVVWITGLPGSGKSALARAVNERIAGSVVLSMDELRKVMTPEPAYTEAERDYVYRALVYTAKTISGLGHYVIIDATGHRSSWRKLARTLIPRYLEVLLDCPVEVCRERERTRTERYSAPGNIYQKGEKGWPVPGLSVPYEKDGVPDLTVDTEKVPLSEAADRVVRFIEEQIHE